MRTNSFPRIGYAVLAAAIATAGAAQEPSAPPPITLAITDVRNAGVPGFGGFGNAQCDEAGNLYFHATRVYNDPLILRLNRKGGTSVYSLPQQEASAWFVAFRVSRRGKLWLLVNAHEGKPLLFEFGSDASMPTRIRLDVPQGLEARNFAMLQNGHVLLQGYFREAPSAVEAGKSGLFEFDASGQLLRRSLDQGPVSALKEVLGRSPDAAAAESEVGDIYLLQDTQVTVVSQTGRVIRRIQVKAPEPGFRASNIAVNGGQLLVSFSRSPDRGLIQYRYSLLDALSGAVLRTYQPSVETGNNAVCFSNDGLEFLKVQHGTLQIMTASLK